MNSFKILATAAIAGSLAIGSAFAASQTAADNGASAGAYAPTHKTAAKQGFGGSTHSQSTKTQPYDGSAAPRASE